jgi:hypothetical protein
VNPEDLAMLEESHELFDALGALEAEPLSDIALEALRAEDRPDPVSTSTSSSATSCNDSRRRSANGGHSVRSC